MGKGKKSLILWRRKLVKELLKNQEMINAYVIQRKCGKSGCKCQKEKGYMHNPAWCFHYKEKGEIKAEYIPSKYANKIKQQVEQYNNYKRIGKEICEINKKLLKMDIKKVST
jgi:hypothetical protein